MEINYEKYSFPKICKHNVKVKLEKPDKYKS